MKRAGRYVSAIEWTVLESRIRAFLCCVVALIAWCYYGSPLSLGSYAMTIRSAYK